jgi:hypothetical protein
MYDTLETLDLPAKNMYDTLQQQILSGLIVVVIYYHWKPHNIAIDHLPIYLLNNSTYHYCSGLGCICESN